MKPSALPTAFVVTAVGALLGARGVFVVLNVAAGPSGVELLAFHQGGLSLWGALCFGTLALFGYCHRGQQPLSPWLTVLTPAALTAIMLGKVGCFLSGACYGRLLSETSWAPLRAFSSHAAWPAEVMALGAGPPVWLAQVERHGLSPSRVLSNPTHPVQLYEAAAIGLLLYIGFRPRLVAALKSSWPSVLLLGYLWLSFAFEFLRDDPERGLMGPQLRLGFGALLGLGLAGALLYWALLGLGYAPRSAAQKALPPALIYGFTLWGIARAVERTGVTQVYLSLAQWGALFSAIALTLMLRKGASAEPTNAATQGPGNTAQNSS